MHQLMAATLDTVLDEIRAIQQEARDDGESPERPRLADDRSAHAEGLDRPESGRRQVQVEGTWRAHQVPLAGFRARKPEHLKMLEEWMKSYQPEELFDDNGTLIAGTCGAGAEGRRAGWARIRMPMAACCCKDLRLPDFRDYAVKWPTPGAQIAEATRVIGTHFCAT